MTTIHPERRPGAIPASRFFPGGLDTTVVQADETGRPPFDGETVPDRRWSEFASGFTKAHAYVESPAGREFYQSVNAQVLKLAARRMPTQS